MSSHASSGSGSSRWKTELPTKIIKAKSSGTSRSSLESKLRDRRNEAKAEKRKQKEREQKSVTVRSQVQLIRYVASAEVAVAGIIVLAQVKKNLL